MTTLTAAPNTVGQGQRARFRSLWRLRSYVLRYRRQFLAMLGLAMIVEFASLSVPLITQRIVDGPLTDGESSGLWLLGGLAVLIGILEAAAGFVRRWIQSYCALDVETEIRYDLYAHLQRLPVAYHDGMPTGQLITRASNDLATIRRFLGFGLIFLLVIGLFFVAVIGQMLYLYWPLGLLVAVTSVPIAIVTTRFEGQYSRAARRCQDLEGDVATVVEESAVGIRVIKALGRGDVVGRRFTGEARHLQSASLAKIRVLAKFWSVLDAVPQLLVAAVLIGGAVAVAEGQLSLGSLAAFVALTVLMAWPVQAFGWILALGQEAATAADRLFDVLDTVPAVRDRDDARALDPGPGRLTFHDVRFGFPDTDREILRGVHLVVEPGQTVAVVGATGSGKSALLALVPRLYDVTGGSIRLDGVDIRELTLDSLREAVSVAFEDPTLFSASVRENITLGRPEATDADVEQAIDVAQAGFVHDLPWGLDTRIGEQGLSLSGGQRQRLALARAVLGRPRLLVLDDPLSALDVHTEALVESALRRVLTGTTALVVAHRASTVLLADKVALLQDGVVTAFGTHSDLLATVPAYQQLLSAEADETVPA